MNYGKRNLSRRKKSISSKKRMKKKRVGVRFFKALIICILPSGIICVIGAAVFAKKIIDNAPAVSAEDILPQGYTTNITDQSGNVLETLSDADSNRVYKTYEEITAIPSISRTHLLPLRTNVSMNTTELTPRH